MDPRAHRSETESHRTRPAHRRVGTGTDVAGLVVTSSSFAAAVVAVTDAAQHPVDGGPHRSPRIAMS